MLPRLQPALSEYYSDKAEPLTTRIFNSIWNTFNPQSSPRANKPKVLDLGKAQPESFNFYSEQATYLTIADCIPALTTLKWPDEKLHHKILSEKIVTKNIEKIIPSQNTQYDLILIWDSFNFIHPKILPYVHNQLLKVCTSKTLIYGFLFTSENRPKYSSTFKILNSDKIQHSVTTDKIVRHTPLTPLAINTYMPNFKYARSVLMRSGLQEFVLTRR